MYLPDHFAERRLDTLRGFIRDHPFGLMVMRRADGALTADGVPFLFDDDGGDRGNGTLRGHVARSNPLWQQAAGGVDVLVVFQGAQSYVSPAWYPSKAAHGKVVPTWNYLMVQARGRLVAIEDRDWLHAFVSRLTDRHEAGRPAPWAVGDAPASYVESMLKAIVGIEIAVTSIEGKWKVSQNRDAADRAGVVRGLEAEPAGDADRAAMAAAVRRGPDGAP